MRRHADPRARGRTEVSAQARHPAPEDLKSASRIRVTSLKIKTTRLILSQSSARGHASRYSDAARPSQPHTPVQAPRAVRFVRPRRPRHREPSPGTHLAKSPRALGAVARADLLHPRQRRRSGVPRVRATDHAARRVLRRNRHDRAPQRRRRGSARRAVLRGTGRLLEVRERATSRCDFLSAHHRRHDRRARSKNLALRRKNTITTRVRLFVIRVGED